MQGIIHASGSMNGMHGTACHCHELLALPWHCIHCIVAKRWQCLAAQLMQAGCIAQGHGHVPSGSGVLGARAAVQHKWLSKRKVYVMLL